MKISIYNSDHTRKSDKLLDFNFGVFVIQLIKLNGMRYCSMFIHFKTGNFMSICSIIV